MIVGFLGRKRSGKDTAVNYLIDNYNFTRYAFGDPVKDVCRTMFNFSEEQLYGDKKDVLDKDWNITPRQAFQTIGTNFAQYGIYKYLPDLKETVPYKTFWVKKFNKWFDNIYKENNDIKVGISDVRFIHEVDEIKRKDGIIIKIINEREILDQHVSENEIDTVSLSKIDYIIENNGSIDELYKKIDVIMQKK